MRLRADEKFKEGKMPLDIQLLRLYSSSAVQLPMILAVENADPILRQPDFIRQRAALIVQRLIARILNEMLKVVQPVQFLAATQSVKPNQDGKKQHRLTDENGNPFAINEAIEAAVLQVSQAAITAAQRAKHKRPI